MSNLPTDAKERKGMPITRGVIDYFPDALAEIARVSLAGNKQHYGPDAPLHWEKKIANDHADCIVRHLIDRGTRDKDGQRHSAKLAWRALALLQIELDEEAKPVIKARARVCCHLGLGHTGPCEPTEP
jgi:hypothetical protein